jgi:hypothetical protein
MSRPSQTFPYLIESGTSDGLFRLISIRDVSQTPAVFAVGHYMYNGVAPVFGFIHFLMPI